MVRGGLRYPTVSTILLARHGESDWNRDGRWQGHADRPLTSKGRRQAVALADQLDGVELAAVYASDLVRAAETARTVAQRRGLPVTSHTDLREVDVGSWTGLDRATIKARYPDGLARWRAGETGWENGESYIRMASRVLACIARIGAAHPHESVLVVAHGGPIRAVRAHALAIDLASHRQSVPVQENGELSAVHVVNGAFTPGKI